MLDDVHFLRLGEIESQPLYFLGVHILRFLFPRPVGQSS
jgi:hypothetical protein